MYRPRANIFETDTEVERILEVIFNHSILVLLITKTELVIEKLTVTSQKIIVYKNFSKCLKTSKAINPSYKNLC